MEISTVKRVPILFIDFRLYSEVFACQNQTKQTKSRASPSSTLAPSRERCRWRSRRQSSQNEEEEEEEEIAREFWRRERIGWLCRPWSTGNRRRSTTVWTPVRLRGWNRGIAIWWELIREMIKDVSEVWVNGKKVMGRESCHRKPSNTASAMQSAAVCYTLLRELQIANTPVGWLDKIWKGLKYWLAYIFSEQFTTDSDSVDWLQITNHISWKKKRRKACSLASVAKANSISNDGK